MMRSTCTVLACVFAAGIGAFAQQKPQPAPSQEKPSSQSTEQPAQTDRAQVSLKVQIVLSRFKGEKKIGSLPYVLGVTANHLPGTSLRMGVQVPIQSGAGYNYREVGTNIDCIARSAGLDRFQLQMAVEDSSIHVETTPGEASANIPKAAADAPAFRTFKSNFTVVLRDGQTAQHTSAVDPFSGEVMKIDITLNVVK